jgi:hypothetical protein
MTVDELRKEHEKLTGKYRTCIDINGIEECKPPPSSTKQPENSPETKKNCIDLIRDFLQENVNIDNMGNMQRNAFFKNYVRIDIENMTKNIAEFKRIKDNIKNNNNCKDDITKLKNIIGNIKNSSIITEKWNEFLTNFNKKNNECHLLLYTPCDSLGKYMKNLKGRILQLEGTNEFFTNFFGVMPSDMAFGSKLRKSTRKSKVRKSRRSVRKSSGRKGRRSVRKSTKVRKASRKSKGRRKSRSGRKARRSVRKGRR